MVRARQNESAPRGPEASVPADAPIPSSLGARGAPLRRLQSGVGNRLLQRYVAARGLGRADGPLEREAEDVAARLTGTVPAPGAGQAGDGAGPLPSSTVADLGRARVHGRPLGTDLRDRYESALGADLSGVRLHTGDRADALSRALGAEALTSGRDVFVGDEVDLGTPEGRHVLAHELTHVAQQQSGAAEPGLVHASRSKKLPKPGKPVKNAITQLEQLWGIDHPSKAQAALLKRLKDGPILSPTELGHLYTLSRETRDPQAAWWLSKADLGSADAARAYVGGQDFTNWLRLSPGRRVWYASLAWREQIGAGRENPPPSFTLGRHLFIKTRQTPDHERDAAKGERDATIRNAFVNTLTRPTQEQRERGTPEQAQANDQAARILTRIFLILQRGLKVYDPHLVHGHVPSAEEVARSLAHGGRVNIRIPAVTDLARAYDLPRWIGLTDAHDNRRAPLFDRDFATHHMDIGANKNGKRGHFIEKGDKGAALANLTTAGVRLWGMNVAAGGFGRQDFNGNVILPDGAHGHLFVGFTPPRLDRDGALQLGMETTAPHVESLVGYVHNWNSKEATANPESSFYGHKTGKVGGGDLDKNQRLVDLKDLEISAAPALGRAGRTWQQELADFERRWIEYSAEMAIAGNERGAYESLVGRQAGRGW